MYDFWAGKQLFYDNIVEKAMKNVKIRKEAIRENIDGMLQRVNKE